ncbi:LysR family transcriptional regulator, glycine cleavage system transcriptional activator [Roseivivax halotolerans]|jgi:LysR family glycine cleavage system transcriptional activator|uniref:LysR family transcriptional regulator, glycine cleavage system transcriptional activator n=1 Tax=Roseivivax halotolerans TaxID=93684 RepID=A0A1I5UMD8_9RHOB|nr:MULTISPECIES: LysR family transcriptional regulator [Roseivivax]QFT64535.1 Glycine cleavage system transcriptional activator [Roseivivax sp. THAF30]SFP96358.1 LysR family transcriptional regulator, glycine cleavage system transcriptional activator [Roseivivax halotolerans]
MEWNGLPPLSALRAFSAYTETGSVTEAGRRLNVSHAAISQQLRALETHLGLKLLDRSGRSLSLTYEGHELAGALSEGFGLIARTIEALTGADAARPLQVTTSPTFAANWLMPRLAGFAGEHPDVEVMIAPTPHLVPLEPGGTDIAIRYGDGNWPGMDSTELMRSPINIVAAPSLVGDGPIPDLKELAGLPWLQELGTTEATEWLKSRGLEDARIRGIHVPGNLMLDGARNGQGIAVSTRVAVEEDLRAGRLRLLFEERRDAGYHAVTLPGAKRPPVKDFLRWVIREAKRDQRT